MVLKLSFVHGMTGQPTDELYPEKGHELEDTWVLPVWPKQFSRNQLERLMKLSTAAGVTVEGSAVEAMQVEDNFQDGEG